VKIHRTSDNFSLKKYETLSHLDEVCRQLGISQATIFQLEEKVWKIGH
jgi:hypothetical protein